MSPNTAFPPESPLDSAIVERILGDPEVVHHVGEHNAVLAMRSELIVGRAHREAAPDLHRELGAVAGQVERVSDEAEIWRLHDGGRNAIDEARRLRGFGPDHPVRGTSDAARGLPAVSPNHLCIVSTGHLSGCPAGPPQPIPEPHHAADFVAPLAGGRTARVVVIDTGYIHTDPPHAALDARVESVSGSHLARHGEPPRWVPDPPDEITTDREGRLHGIVGHGTFVAGLIAHLCPAARLTVVGQRDEDVQLDGAPTRRLYTSEAALAHSLLAHAGADVDVVQLGFAFPTLDDHPSIPFTHAIDVLSGSSAPRRGVAVVAPAGNESSARPHWPAALPGVIGVAATNRRGRSRARFSNWGTWLECCARGEDVVSTYIHWTGPVEGDHLDELERFVGWARWDGTSFAAPKVSAAIARLVAADPDGELLPTDAFARLLDGGGDVAVTSVTDHDLGDRSGVTLPQLLVR